MKTLFSVITMILFISTSVLAQDHFLVELETRSPDVQAQVKGYEGYPSIQFMASDTEGTQHTVNSLKGKVSYLYFWNEDCPKCIEYLDALNRVQDENPSTLNVLSFSDNKKDEVISFLETKQLNFPVIANSKLLADGPYGGDFGYPRLFIIDEDGIIKYVIPEAEMRGNFDAYGFFDAVQRSLQKK
ncbi:TlpA family protein disulfide reductase [Saprospiraceae bacterium]|nr:TlpA family protein disulfide reductase [Saprospiraceae bacterium]